MGRAKGDPARSKSRPSSSSLAAAHLQMPGGAPLGFGGYVGSSRLDTSLSTEREVSLDVDGEAAVHLKRLSKRDSTTKLKALAALRSIFKEHSSEELVKIMIAWVFEYKRLVQDNKRQVRESTHTAMAELTSNAGRGLAPHLRSLMGPWWVSQFDPSREVAEAAQYSFQVTFPGRKRRVDTLVYCLKDIVNCLDENLKLTPQILSELGTPLEEAAEKNERILSSSLLALAALLDVLVGSTSSLWREGPAEGSPSMNVAEEAAEAVKEAATAIFHKHKCLRIFVKHKSSQIRSAAYQALRTYIQHIPQVFTELDTFDDAVKSVLGSLAEKDASCHQPMWDMVLLFAKAFPQAWGCECIRKAVLPRLWEFLKHGCFGSQQISYPYIFPLLTLIPPKLMAPSQKFLVEFFSSLWQGGSIASLSSPDRVALLTTFHETFVWVVRNIKRYAVEEGLKVEELQSFLVKEVLLNIIWYNYLRVGGQVPFNNDSEEKTTASNDKHLSRSIDCDGKDIVSATVSGKASEEMAASIVDMMVLLGQEEGVLDAFWPGFHNVCLNIVLNTSPDNQLRLTRVAKFFRLLEVEISRDEKTREKWPLQNAVQPLVANAFSTLKPFGHPEAIRFLGQLTSSYGTSAFALTALAAAEGVEYFFQNELVPWCLTGDSNLTTSKIDLLLAFFEEEDFQGFWDATLAYVTTWHLAGENELLHEDLEKVAVLATLVEKFSERRERLGRPKGKSEGKPPNIEDWRSSRIDAAGLAVACSTSLSHPSCLCLLRNLLGATNPKGDLPLLLSTEAAVRVLDKLLQRMLAVLCLFDMAWTNAAPTLILMDRVVNISTTVEINDKKKEEAFQLASSALKVVSDALQSIFHLRNEVIESQLLAAVFCLYWASSWSTPNVKGEVGDESDSEDEMRDDEMSTGGSTERRVQGDNEPSSDTLLEQCRASFESCLRALRQNASPLICRGMSASSRGQVRWILIQCTRNALFDGSCGGPSPTAVRGASWVYEVVEYFCVEEDETQETISLSLAPGMSWPIWVEPSQLKDDSSPVLKFAKEIALVEEEKQKQVAAFADSLSTYLGPERVYSGCSPKSSITHSIFQRVWLVIELLCTREWPGGSAQHNLVPFLCECARKSAGGNFPLLLEICLRSLFAGSSSFSSEYSPMPSVDLWVDEEDVSKSESNPFTSALLLLLRALLDGEVAWGREDAQRLLFEYVVTSESAENFPLLCSNRVLPSVLSILMPVIRKQLTNTSMGEGVFNEGQFLRQAVCGWINTALEFPPLSASGAGLTESGEDWIQVAVSCFPLQLAGGMSGIAAASSAQVTYQEKFLLLKLLQRQISSSTKVENQQSPRMKVAAHGEHGSLSELILAKLVCVSVAYSWQDFGVEEWAFVLGCLRKWLDNAVLEFEEMTEAVVNLLDGGKVRLSDLEHLLQNVSISEKKCSIELVAVAIAILIMIKDLNKLEAISAVRALATLRLANWAIVEDHMMEDSLRLLLATGLAKSAAMDPIIGVEGATLISVHRKAESCLWQNLAEIALRATDRAREAAVRAADLWGVGKGSISALYALLFSPNSIGALQWVSFQFLSTAPLQEFAVTWGGLSSNQGENEDGAQQQPDVKGGESPAAIARLRPELSCVLETSAKALLQSSLTSNLRVHYLLGWSLLLMRLQALPPLSPRRERILQFTQESDTPSVLLECLFQHIPLDLSSGASAFRKRTSTVRTKSSVGATAAKQSALTGSVSFAVESLWPVREEQLAVLSGAIYGLLLRVLPACVRTWYTELRDRSTASAIEVFTTNNCSHHLLADEFSQVQNLAIVDETLSIRANRTLREVTAVYKKEEAGMDIVIRLPACYPLRAVEVECTRRLGINETLLRKWILSMKTFLRNQNGALLEAVNMWKRNVDREFEGVEECPICYSIIHTTNHSLPRLACKTCKHKFHSACLYKWFSTSHKSTCPLCQTPF